ncbi:MAG TPA: CHASE3 domain-containing protein, partial [Rhodopila sp.]|nr:CHASE3 domain-containing protein [Rhodopila sp.]
MSHRLVARAHLISFAVLIGVIGLVGLLSWDRLNAARSARDWTMHTYEVLGTIRNLGMAVREAEDGQRGYLLTGADADIAMYDSAVENASVMLGNLQRLTADNPTQQQHLHELGMGWQQRLQQLAQVIQVRRDRGLQAAAGIVGTEVGRATSNTIMAALSDMKDEEQRLLT